MNAAIIDEYNQVVFYANVPDGVRQIEIAGAVARDGSPVNRKTFRVSRSQRNLRKIETDDFLRGSLPLVEREYHGLTFYVDRREQ